MTGSAQASAHTRARAAALHDDGGLLNRAVLAVAGVAVVAAAGGVVLAAPWAQTSAVPDVVATGEGPVPFRPPDSAAGSCYQLYSLRTLPDATFAFAGTVTTIDTGGPLFTDSMTFAVDRWFRGGEAPEVTLPVPAPARPGDTSFSSGQDDVPAVTVGTQLLVAGSSRSGEPGMEDPIAWATCDFVRYFDPDTAQSWADVLD